jgi:hypothetical protein
MRAAQRRASRPLFGLAGVNSATTRSTFSGSNPYPYPTHANPNPYQIFHLPHNASQAEVKRRCKSFILVCSFDELSKILDIDLVRIYHPDSPVSRALPPEVTDGRFQAITKAYDALRGKTPMTPEGIQSTSDARNPTSAVWRARQARRLDLDTGGDDRWKDKVILFGAIFVGNLLILRIRIYSIGCFRRLLDLLHKQCQLVERRLKRCSVKRPMLIIIHARDTRKGPKIGSWLQNQTKRGRSRKAVHTLVFMFSSFQMYSKNDTNIQKLMIQICLMV